MQTHHNQTSYNKQGTCLSLSLVIDNYLTHHCLISMTTQSFQDLVWNREVYSKCTYGGHLSNSTLPPPNKTSSKHIWVNVIKLTKDQRYKYITEISTITVIFKYSQATNGNQTQHTIGVSSITKVKAKNALKNRVKGTKVSYLEMAFKITLNWWRGDPDKGTKILTWHDKLSAEPKMVMEKLASLGWRGTEVYRRASIIGGVNFTGDSSFSRFCYWTSPWHTPHSTIYFHLSPLHLQANLSVPIICSFSLTASQLFLKLQWLDPLHSYELKNMQPPGLNYKFRCPN